MNRLVYSSDDSDNECINRIETKDDSDINGATAHECNEEVKVSDSDTVLGISYVNDETFDVEQSVIDGLAQLDKNLHVSMLNPSTGHHDFGEPSPELTKKLDLLFEKHDNGHSFNESLQNLKSFHNPSILQRIAKMYKIDQYGSNFPSK